MPLVLDTETVAAGDRADMTSDAMQRNTAPSHLRLDGPGDLVSARLESWELGATTFSRLRVSGFSVVRTPKQIRVSPSPALLLIRLRQADIRWVQADVQYALTPSQLFPVDLNLCYEAAWSGGRLNGLEVRLDRLALSPDTIRRALPRIQASPLYQLVSRHIAYLDEFADSLHADPAAAEVGEACAETVRALFVSAARNGSEDGTALPAEVMLTQIREYVRRHLTDPDLDAGRIARAHHISVRYLYKLCAQAGLRLEQWIITERLHRTHTDLARPEYRHRTVAEIAYHHGFRNPSHFTRRFRAAYGMTPIQWRRTALDGKP